MFLQVHGVGCRRFSLIALVSHTHTHKKSKGEVESWRQNLWKLDSSSLDCPFSSSTSFSRTETFVLIQTSPPEKKKKKKEKLPSVCGICLGCSRSSCFLLFSCLAQPTSAKRKERRVNFRFWPIHTHAHTQRHTSHLPPLTQTHTLAFFSLGCKKKKKKKKRERWRSASVRSLWLDKKKKEKKKSQEITERESTELASAIKVHLMSSTSRRASACRWFH